MISQPATAEQAEDVSLLMFEVQGQACAIPVESVSQILHLPELSRPAGTPAILDGYLNLQGRPIAVVTLARLFGLEASAPSLYTPLILLRDDLGEYAVRVSSVQDLARVSKLHVRPLLDQHVATGSCLINDRVVSVLTPSALFQAGERERIHELAQIEQKRQSQMHPETPVA